MKRSRRINKSIFIIPILFISVVFVFLLLITNITFLFKKSIHDDASRYMTKHALVFYPNSSIGKKYAKQMAKDIKDDRVYDYSLVPYGDYFLVDYGNGVSYFVDKEYNEIVINEVDEDGKRIIADYLRYWVKRNNNDLYYTSEFIEKSYIDNLSFDNVLYSIEDEYLKCKFIDFDEDVLVPLKYIQNNIQMNFGYPNELYVKPTYIDDDHPVICLTFDDGPQFWYESDESSSISIVDTLYRYDVCATFYVVGDCLLERDAWSDYEVYSFLKTSINNGNEYGSHTQSHDPTLNKLSSNEIVKAIKGPSDFFKQNLDYNMKTYRPPEGIYNDDVLDVQPYPAILWSVDSLDWLLRDEKEIYEKVFSYDIEDGDILLFHEIYDETANAIKKIVPELINRGYQMVSVSDMLRYKGIDITNLKYYYNLNPWPYYE